MWPLRMIPFLQEGAEQKDESTPEMENNAPLGDAFVDTKTSASDSRPALQSPVSLSSRNERMVHTMEPQLWDPRDTALTKDVENVGVKTEDLNSRTRNIQKMLMNLMLPL